MCIHILYTHVYELTIDRFGDEILLLMLSYCPVLHLSMLRLCWANNIKTLKSTDFFFTSAIVCVILNTVFRISTPAKCLVSILSMSNFIYLIKKSMHLRFCYSMTLYMKLSSTNMSHICLRTYLRLKTVSRNNPNLRYLLKIICKTSKQLHHP